MGLWETIDRFPLQKAGELRDVLRAVSEAKRFDCSAIFEEGHRLVQRSAEREIRLTKVFLPNYDTWMSFRLDGIETAVLFRADATLQAGSWWAFISQQSPLGFEWLASGSFDFNRSLWAGGMTGRSQSVVCEDARDHPDRERLVRIVFSGIYGALALLADTRITEQIERRPSRQQLRRMLRDTSRAPGKFPLGAITEVVIRIGPKTHGSAQENVLTGRRALHWVRAHPRLCANGTITIVKPHERGDASLGIIRSRYTLEPA